MNTLSRKQREIANRHSLFLDIAKTMLAEDGFHNLSMERVAEVAEYSKGTVYQHFSCKEEMLLQLANSAMTQLLALFKRASGYEGSNRDRLLAVCYAHFLWSEIDNHCMDMLQHIGMHGFREKVTDISLQRHDELEQGIIGTVAQIVQTAIEQGELAANTELNPYDIVFGLWSLCFGGQVLQASDIPLESLGVKNPAMALIRTLDLTLDGLGWQPLHDEQHFSALLAVFRTELFATETTLLRKQGNTRMI